MTTIDDLAATLYKPNNRSDLSVTLLPDPPRAERRYTVISVDDHLVEPPHTFEGRVARRFAERAPRVIELQDGSEAWIYDW